MDQWRRDIRDRKTRSVATGVKVEVKGYATTTYYSERLKNNVSHNVIGKVEGTDPRLKTQYIVIGGHLDHLGVTAGVIYPGADDDASGAATVMEMARLFAANAATIKPKRTVVFALWCGEELGLLGSEYYGSHPTDGVTMDNVVANFNNDMVGLGEGIGAPGALNFPAIFDVIMKNQDADVAKAVEPSTAGPGGSDYSAFIVRGIEYSTNEGGTTVSSMTNVLDVLDPSDVNIYRDLAGGVTVASVFHGSANPIGGTNTIIKLRWGKTRAEELVFDAGLPGLKFALGENPKAMRTAGATPGPQRYPASRPGVEFVIRDAFTRAKAYQRAWQDYERRKKAGEDVVAPRRDLQLDPLVEVLEGRRLTHVHAYRADEMLMMLRLAEEFGFKVTTFEHGLEGYKVAKELAAHGAAVGTFSDWWGYKIEAIDAIPYNAAIMMKAGVVVSID